MFEMLIIFLILMLIIAAMSVGVLFGKKPITGSCGGLNNLEPGRECELCGGNPSKCVEQ
tara:strand:- start:1210 stop:1386 length:177 start_codon:yes stop_codon:yes gene_type:complete